MDALELVKQNLLSPIVLSFLLGIAATLLHSDLRIPQEIYAALSIYLLFSIGMKGGAELAELHSLSVFAKPALAALVVGSMIPIMCYFILRRFGKFSVIDAAAIAAHYGSVSAVTFIATLNFLERQKMPYEGFMPAVVAVLEVPAIVIALGIAGFMSGKVKNWGAALHEIFTGKSILLLVGGITIGYFAGHKGWDQVAPFFYKPFKGVLCLFLLEMGMVAARRFGDLPKVGLFLIGFGILMPIVNGTLGAVAGYFAGLSVGGAMVLAVLCASASYIAATAAIRVSLPEANPGYYLTAALAITFPFNLTVGIPLYLAITKAVFGGAADGTEAMAALPPVH
jgi:hypothetical protein